MVTRNARVTARSPANVDLVDDKVIGPAPVFIGISDRMRTSEAYQQYVTSVGGNIPYDRFAVWWAKDGMRGYYKQKKQFEDAYEKALRRFYQRFSEAVEFTKDAYDYLMDVMLEVFLGIPALISKVKEIWKIFDQLKRRYEQFKKLVENIRKAVKIYKRVMNIIGIVGAVVAGIGVAAVFILIILALAGGTTRNWQNGFVQERPIVKQIITSQGIERIVYDERIQTALNYLHYKFGITDVHPMAPLFPGAPKGRIPDSQGEPGPGGEEQFVP